MTPQAYSYPTVGQDNLIYVPPYGLTEELDLMLVINPKTYEINKIQLDKNGTTEKYTYGITVGSKIYWLPYGENRVLIYDTATKEHKYVQVDFPEDRMKTRGKYVMGHIYNDKIYALPYGETEPLDQLLIVDLLDDSVSTVTLETPVNDKKKWHQSVIRNGIIYASPRSENRSIAFNYAIEFNCNDHTYILRDFSKFYPGYEYSTMKYTTMAIANDVIYSIPYGYVDDFDFLLTNKDNEWSSERIGITDTTRKYFTHIVTKNNKIYCPPAGHHVEWSKFLIIDGNTGQRTIKDLGVGYETKKYFTGLENSQGKVFYIPRGGCVCDPFDEWKRCGDLAEILVIDTKDDTHYTIDISECFTDNTTIEKYNACCMIDDVIFAMPYGESDSFQTVLVFDTIQEKIIKTLDLNEL
jgi:hypothetical protein